MQHRDAATAPASRRLRFPDGHLHLRGCQEHDLPERFSFGNRDVVGHQPEDSLLSVQPRVAKLSRSFCRGISSMRQVRDSSTQFARRFDDWRRSAVRSTFRVCRVGVPAHGRSASRACDAVQGQRKPLRVSRSTSPRCRSGSRTSRESMAAQRLMALRPSKASSVLPLSSVTAAGQYVAKHIQGPMRRPDPRPVLLAIARHARSSDH